jgi:hypothetical protein
LATIKGSKSKLWWSSSHSHFTWIFIKWLRFPPTLHYKSGPQLCTAFWPCHLPMGERGQKISGMVGKGCHLRLGTHNKHGYRGTYKWPPPRQKSIWKTWGRLGWQWPYWEEAVISLWSNSTQ